MSPFAAFLLALLPQDLLDPPPAAFGAVGDDDECVTSPTCSADLPQDDEEFHRARKLLDQGNLRAAEKAFRRIVEEHPDHGWAWFLLAFTVHKFAEPMRGDERRVVLEQALELHLKATEFERVRAAAFYNAACACALLGRTEEAFQHLDSSFESGFERRSMLETDRDLVSLRGDPRFARYLPVDEREPFHGEVRVLHSFLGESAGDKFGWSGRNAGDCDGDGVNDLIVSAPFKKIDGANAGKVYVYSGATGKLLFARTGPPGAKLGIGVESGGDVDGDGHADVIAGATFSGREAGRVFVYSGADGSTLLELSARESGDLFGTRVAGIGDVDGDGRTDLAVGAPGSDEFAEDAGRVYVFSGGTGKLLRTIDGRAAGDEFGDSVAGVVVDGTPLLAVGAGSAGRGGRGRVVVFELGRKGVRPRFLIDADRTGVHLGHMFLSFLGDLDGDGFPDVYASDWENNARGYTTGRIYVHSGRTGERLLQLTGEHAGDGFGSGPGNAGDVDGDGRADLIVGAWRSNQGATMAGKCTVFSADGDVLLELVHTDENAAFGFDAVGMGDVDGDGGADFLVTAAWSDENGKRAGRVFLIAGPRLEPRLTVESSGGR